MSNRARGAATIRPPRRGWRLAVGSGVLTMALGAGALMLVVAACGAGTSRPAGTEPSVRAPATPPAAPAAQAPAPADATASQPATPPPPLKLVANWTQLSGSMSPIWVTYEAGLFREQGLDVELLNIPNTSRVLQTMAAGEINLSPLDPATTIRAGLGGLDVPLLFAQTNRLVFGVYGQPSITDPQQLRGKVIGTTRIGASNHTATVVALDSWGLVPDRDVALRQLGEVPAIYAALQAGQIDAATFGLPVNRATLPDQRELLNLANDGPEYASIAIGGPRAWIATNEEAVRRFARAFALGIQRFKADKAFTLDVYRRYFQADEPQFFEDTYALFSRHVPTVPYVSEAGMARAFADLLPDEPSLAGRQPSEWLESRFVRELEESGFLRGEAGTAAGR
jgi:ABC-type nitrate/sulfonate/bicarbonate transport system substrate-binding protein